MKYLLIILFSAIFLLFALYAVYLYFNQSKHIYFPTRHISVTPLDAGLSYEDLIIETPDAVNISAWYVPAKNPQATVLFLHGNGGNISHRIEFIEMFYSLNISTFIIDYRGYGKSEGSPTEEGTYIDSEAAWNYLVSKKNTDPSKIIIYGRSLGGPIAARLASKQNPAALVLDSTFTSIKDVAAKLYPYLPVKRFLKFDYNTKSYIRDAACPVLIIHSLDDSYISFENAEALYQAAPAKKELVKVSGNHNTNFTVSGHIYKSSIEKLLNEFIKGH